MPTGPSPLVPMESCVSDRPALQQGSAGASSSGCLQVAAGLQPCRPCLLLSRVQREPLWEPRPAPSPLLSSTPTPLVPQQTIRWQLPLISGNASTPTAPFGAWTETAPTGSRWRAMCATRLDTRGTPALGSCCSLAWSGTAWATTVGAEQEAVVPDMVDAWKRCRRRHCRHCCFNNLFETTLDSLVFLPVLVLVLLLACRAAYMQLLPWPHRAHLHAKPAAAPDDVLAAIRIDDAAISSGSITNFEWPACHWCAVAVAAMQCTEGCIGAQEWRRIASQLDWSLAAVRSQPCDCASMPLNACRQPATPMRRQGSGPAALREPGPGQPISDTNVTWGSEGNTNRTLAAEQQAAQAANCSGTAGVAQRLPGGGVHTCIEICCPWNLLPGDETARIIPATAPPPAACFPTRPCRSRGAAAAAGAGSPRFAAGRAALGGAGGRGGPGLASRVRQQHFRCGAWVSSAWISWWLQCAPSHLGTVTAPTLLARMAPTYQMSHPRGYIPLLSYHPVGLGTALHPWATALSTSSWQTMGAPSQTIRCLQTGELLLCRCAALRMRRPHLPRCSCHGFTRPPPSCLPLSLHNNLEPLPAGG